MPIELRYIEYPPPMPVIGMTGYWSHAQPVGSLDLTTTVLLSVTATARQGQGYVQMQLMVRNATGTVSPRGAPFALPAWAVADVGRLLQAAGEKAGELPGVVKEK